MFHVCGMLGISETYEYRAIYIQSHINTETYAYRAIYIQSHINICICLRVYLPFLPEYNRRITMLLSEGICNEMIMIDKYEVNAVFNNISIVRRRPVQVVWKLFRPCTQNNILIASRRPVHVDCIWMYSKQHFNYVTATSLSSLKALPHLYSE